MKRNDFKQLLASIVIAGLCFVLALPAMAINNYSLTDLGTDKYLFAINNEGQAAGVRLTNGYLFIYENGIITELCYIGSAQPLDINDSGQIVGNFYFDADNNGVFIWDNETLVDLSPFIGGPATPNAINNNAQIAVTGNGAFLYDYENEVITPLDMLGGTTVVANGINNYGHVVGLTNAGGAWLYENGNMRLIGTFPNRTRPNTAIDINDFGEVIGFYDNGSAYVPFLWKNEETTYLPSIYENNTRPFAINNLGQIVGKGNVESGERGLLWEDGIVYDLSELISANNGWVIMEALDINDNGHIVGRGIINGQEHAVILTPISAPTIVAILNFFDESVANGTIYGRGRIPWIANARLWTFRQMLESAKRQLDNGRINRACRTLHRIERRCDGEPLPKDFIKGDAVPDLYEMVLDLIELECE